MNLSKRKFIKPIFLSFIVVLTGCREYDYSESYRIENRTDQSLSGIVITDKAIYFDIEPRETIELFSILFTGDGATPIPTFSSYGRLCKCPVRQVHITSINQNESSIIIEVIGPTPRDYTEEDWEDLDWEFSADVGVAIYTFPITEDHLKP